MKAMVLRRIQSLEQEERPLTLEEWPDPRPAPGELLVRVLACGVCHTELDEIEGRTPPPVLPVILGHQVVGRVEESAAGPEYPRPGDRIGIAWIYDACGVCPFCREGRENLCPDFRATGRDAHGGYGEWMTVPAASAFHLPASFSDTAAAPLLCAGAVGYRSLRLAGLANGEPLGLSGFGASAHLVIQLARHLFPDSPVLVFARGEEEQSFARELGAAWAGSFEDRPPVRPRAVIDTTPVWGPVLASLNWLERGGRLVINAIRKEDAGRSVLLGLDYAAHLWQEKEVKSVANVTRQDVREFLDLAGKLNLQPEVQEFPLTAANQALQELRQRKIRGAKVLVP